MNTVLHIGLLGAGRIGRIHGHNIAAHPRARLAGVADASAEAAESLASATGSHVRDLDSIVEDRGIYALLICNPTDLHADLIERAARAEKAVFCEKPVDLDAERIRHCLQVVDEAGARLMIGFNRRFDPSFAGLRRRIGAGEIGAVEIVTILSRAPEPPPPAYAARSGGLFRDMMIHDLDMAR